MRIDPRKRFGRRRALDIGFCSARGAAGVRAGGRRGVIALMTVIIIGALILSIGISAALVAQTEIVMIGQSDREYQARSLAMACLDEGLFRLKLDSAYVGGTVPVGSEDCTISVSGVGSSRTIAATATVAGFTKTVNVSASRRQNSAGNAAGWHLDALTESDPP